MPLHTVHRSEVLADLQPPFIRQAFTVAEDRLAGFDSRGQPRRC
jgi:hypothetical protein